MIRLFALLFIFYSSLLLALADGVCLAPHHHNEHTLMSGCMLFATTDSGIDPNAAEHLREARAAQAAGNLEQGMNAAQHAQNLAAQAGVNSSGLLANSDKGFKLLAEHGVRGVVGAGVSDIAGEDHPWRNLLRTTAANVVGQWGAGQIGQAHMDTSSIFNNPMVHKLAHGVVGALSGALMGGRGCTASGALGAMIGETLGCMMLDEPLAAQEHAVGGRILTKAEYEALNQKAFDHYKQHIADVAKMAKIMTVMGSALTGLNVEVANQTAANAIDHNFVHVAAFGLLMASAGYSSYCVYQALKNDGPVAALQQAGIEIAVNAAGVATGKFLVKAGGKVLQCEGVKQALEAAYKHTPGLEAALSALTPKLISAIEAFDKTALGKAVGRLENQLVHLEDKLFRRVFDGNTIKVREVHWGKGIHEQGMPFEDYIATKLPGGNKLISEGGSRLPKNFKTFDYFDPAAKRAVSVKTLDTGAATRLENPSQMYGTLKRNIDAMINFDTWKLGRIELETADIMSRELYFRHSASNSPCAAGGY